MIPAVNAEAIANATAPYSSRLPISLRMLDRCAFPGPLQVRILSVEIKGMASPFMLVCFWD